MTSFRCTGNWHSFKNVLASENYCLPTRKFSMKFGIGLFNSWRGITDSSWQQVVRVISLKPHRLRARIIQSCSRIRQMAPVCTLSNRLHDSVSPDESTSKRHFDRFIRFCRTYPCAKHSVKPTETTEHTTSVGIGRISVLHAMLPKTNWDISCVHAHFSLSPVYSWRHRVTATRPSRSTAHVCTPHGATIAASHPPRVAITASLLIRRSGCGRV